MSDIFIRGLAEAEEESSMFRKTGRALTYGTAGALTSGVLSFVNTGIALGNALGIKGEQIDTEESVASVFGRDAADYYGEHSGALDLIGFAAGSLVPGLGAIKVAKAAAAGGLATNTSKLATAVRYALAEDAGVTSVVQGIRSGARQATLAGNRMPLVAHASVNQMTEFAIFDAAVMLTMNQSSILNQGHLSYFDSIVENAPTSALMAVGLGGTLGGAIGFAVQRGKLKGILDTAWKDTINEQVLPTIGAASSNAGGQLVSLTHSLTGTTKKLEELRALPRAQQDMSQIEALQRLQAELRIEIQDTVKRATVGRDDLGEVILQQAELLGADTEALSGMFGYAKKFRTYKDTEAGIDGRIMAEELDELPSLFRTAYLGKDVDMITAVAALRSDLLGTGVHALPEEKLSELFLDAAGLLEAQDIAALFKKTFLREVNIKLPSGKTMLKDDYPEIADYWERQTQLVRGRHGKTRALKDKPQVTTVIDVHDSLHRLSYEFDAEYRQVFDALTTKLKSPTDNFEDIGLLFAEYTALANPQQSFASAYRIFNHAELQPELLAKIAAPDSEYRGLYEWMNNNRALKKKYGTTTVYMDMKTMNATNRPNAAHFSDFGKVSFSPNGSTISAGNLSVNVGKTLAKFTAAAEEGALSLQEVSGLYMWSAAQGGAGKTAVNVSEGASHNLPQLEAAFNFYHFKPKQPFVLRQADGSTKEIASAAELKQEILAERIRVVQENMKAPDATRLTDEQLAVRLNIPVDDVHTISLGQTPEFKQFARDELYRRDLRGNESFIPNTVVVEYDAAALDAAMGKAPGAAEVATFLWQRAQSNEVAGRRILGEEVSANIPTIHGDDPTTAMRLVEGLTPNSNTTTFVKSAQPEDYFDPQTLIAQVGQELNNDKRRVAKLLTDEFRAVASAVSENPDAVMEVNILLQSVLRGDSFEFMSTKALGFTEVEKQVLASVGIDLDAQIAEHFMRNIGVDGEHAAGYLLSTEAKRVMQEKLAGVVLPEDPAALQAWQEQFTAAMRTGEQGYGHIVNFQQELAAALRDAATVVNDEAFIGLTKNVHKIEHVATRKFLDKMHEMNNTHIIPKMMELAAAEGTPMRFNPNQVYSYGVSIKNYKHVGIVRFADAETNPWAMGEGMIFGVSEADYKAKVLALQREHGDNLIVKGMQEIADDAKSKGQFDASLTISEFAYNHSKLNKGKAWNVVPDYNPNIMQEHVNNMIEHISNLKRQGVGLVFRSEIANWELLNKVAQSRSLVGGEKAPQTSFGRNINMLLGLRSGDDYRWWHTAQQSANEMISRGYGKVRGAIVKASMTGKWDGINKLLEQHGMPVLFSGKEEFLTSGVEASSSLLPELVGKLNALNSFTILRMDTAHAFVNAVSMPIVALPEMQILRDSLNSLDPATRKWLQGNLSAAVDDAGTRIPSNMKLLLQGATDFATKRDIVEEYVKRGIIGRDVLEFKQMEDGVARALGTGKLQAIRDAVDKPLRLLTAFNDGTESFVKFTAGRMAQLALDGARVDPNSPLYWSTIQAYVNKVNGTYISSQRPEMFQGWFGTAFGLFQTYQFNYIQQLTRYIQKNKEAARAMIALQVGVFGGQSIPGFKQMNDIIADKTLGEQDFFLAANAMLDKPVAEFLLYGGGSSLTRPMFGGKGINLFTRGDLTPRTPILVPTAISDIPAWNYVTNVGKTLVQSVQAVTGDEATGQAMLAAWSKTGMSRPIAGIAQMWQGQRLTQQGTALLNYQDADWATWAAKVMGSQTLDEAIAVNSFYRAQGFRARQLERINDLAASVRTKIRAGQVDRDELLGIMGEYKARGGNQSSFGVWMRNQYANANDSNIATMREAVGSTHGKYLQASLGAYLDDYDKSVMQTSLGRSK